MSQSSWAPAENMGTPTENHEPDLGKIMHTLGQIAGAVWPNGGMPCGMQSTFLSAPNRGFDMIVNHEGFTRGDIDRIIRLLDLVPGAFTRDCTT